MTELRGRGWRRSVRRAKYAFSPRAALSIADTVDLVQFAPALFDQGGVGSCFGHGIASGVAAAFAAGGKPLNWTPSPASIYRLTRAMTRSRMKQNPRTTPLEDTGSYPVDGFDAIEQFGVKPMGPRALTRNTDCFGDAVNAEPVQSELEADAEHLVVGKEVLTWGPSGPNSMRLAQTMRHPTPYGIFVDTAFEKWNPTKGFLGAPENPYDPRGGGHYVVGLGYTRAGLLAQDAWKHLPERMRPANPDWEKAIGSAAAKLPSDTPVNFGLNSWGNWGLNGFFLFLDELYQDVQSGDGYAVEAKWR